MRVEKAAKQIGKITAIKRITVKKAIKQTGKTTATKKIRVEKAVRQIGKTTVRIKIIRGLVIQYYYYGGINVNIKFKIAG